MGVKKKMSNQGITTHNLPSHSKSGGRRGTNQGKSTADGPAAEHAPPDMRQLVWQVVAMIPPGKVASYGQIAALIGFPRHSRFVGTTLRQLPKNTKLPWYRVVNSSLRISQRGGGEARQRRLLEAEDVTFVGGRILAVHKWDARA